MKKSDFFIKSKKLFIYFFQIILTLIILSYTFFILFQNITYVKKTAVLKNNNLYLAYDNTSNNQINYMMNVNNNDSLKNLKDLFSFIINNDNLTLYSHFFYYRPELDYTGNSIKHYYIDNNFSNLFKLNIQDGYYFNNDDFNTNSNMDHIPILVGYNLKNIYELDKTYSITDPITGNTLNYKVIGVLSSNSKYISANYDMYENLDSSIIQPLFINDINKSDNFSQLDLLITKSLIKTNNSSVLNEIEKKSNNLNLFKLEYVSVESSINSIVKLLNRKLLVPFFLSFILLALDLYTLKKIYFNKKNQKTYYHY